MAEAAPPKPKTGPKDKPPRKSPSGAAKRTARKAADLALIREGFTELLKMPAIPLAMKGDEWAADHFIDRGPKLAERIVAECERNDRLRTTLAAAMKGQGVMMLGVELFFYIGFPLMHWGIIPGGEAFDVPVLAPARAPVPPAGRPFAAGGPKPPQPEAPAPEASPADPPEDWEGEVAAAAAINGDVELPEDAPPFYVDPEGDGFVEGAPPIEPA